ncbi:MAG: serine/threonine-protein kinase [Planctomycetota bacterium]
MQREIELFHEALEQPASKREAFIRSRHAGEAELARRLLELLRAHERAARDKTSPPRPSVGSPEPLPEFIGPYRIRERLGEGGMGVVYAAEQTEPLRRQVAVKVVKLGMDTREVLARFEAERRTLALLDHPGVAKVFDAGATKRGRPYFVMEFVRGVSLIDYCERNRLSLRDRLRIFVDLCDAIQHAHHKGIIHRDLKPSNILVAVPEGRPIPKVIDFGVAKATASPLSERPVFTEQGQLIGTPEYMSPEQAEMSGLDVDTRTDVYALGVILYEMLTSKLPFEPSTLRAGGYSEVVRRIREVVPPKPSTRLSEIERSTSAADRAARDQLITSSRQVRGELDWIVMRALEKDRTRRYDAASALGDDVENYLHDRPVVAGPPSAGYALYKFAKRHRAATVATGLAAASMILGITGLAIGMLRATRAEDLATRRADASQASSRFLGKLLFQADPERHGGNPSLLDVLERTDPLIDEDLALFPEVEADIRESLGVALRRRSMYTSARPSLERSLALRTDLFGEHDPATARSQIALAGLLIEADGDLAAASDLLARAHATYPADGKSGTLLEAWLLLDIGLTQLAADHLDEAENALEACRRLMIREYGTEHRDISRPLRGLAAVALARGRADKAKQLALEAVRLSTVRDAQYLNARAKMVLADVLLASGTPIDLAPAYRGISDKGRLDSIKRLVDSANQQLYRTIGRRHLRLAECSLLLARVAFCEGDFLSALKFVQESEEQCEQMQLHRDHILLIETKLMGMIACSWLRPSQFDHLRGVLSLRPDPEGPVRVGRHERISNKLLRAAKVTEDRYGADHPLTLRIYATLIRSSIARGEPDLVRQATEQLEARREARRSRLSLPAPR